MVEIAQLIEKFGLPTALIIALLIGFTYALRELWQYIRKQLEEDRALILTQAKEAREDADKERAASNQRVADERDKFFIALDKQTASHQQALDKVTAAFREGLEAVTKERDRKTR